MKNITLPIVLIVLGTLWLLHALQWMPDLRWLWVIGLVGAGVAILIIEGINQSSILAGPLLILSGGLYFVRIEYGLAFKIMIPILMIALGCLMLLSRSGLIPSTKNIAKNNKNANLASEHTSPNSAQH